MRSTIVLNDRLADKIKLIVGKRKLSEFINAVLEEKLAQLEREALKEKMKEGYLATKSDRKELNEDWKAVDGEGWE